MQGQEASEAAEATAALAGRLRTVIGQLRRRFRAQDGQGDLSWSQKSVLLHLEREGAATVSALARREGVRPQSMGATAASLQAAGLVSSEPDPDDGRQTLLALTPACREWLAAARSARQDWLVRALGERLDADERARLADAAELLARLTETE
ncbi:MarR family winged helix-turn-helix transcriptional regulator [Pararhizobium mangrovi]|uniref:MarR family transcriptional regulator n=1 Tax=Pararhizobium mangrovi TaxID=2590452 RepID=A0A506U631_9HYPH|nr:MarR family transcriptional regulator [Pararhizobium mangrovi]TPW29310.1 MarR family transcriptional regulator [Pararhizobium mangrovi]